MIVIVDDYFWCGYEEAMMMIAVLIVTVYLVVVVVATCSHVAGYIIHHDQEVEDGLQPFLGIDSHRAEYFMQVALYPRRLD